MDDTIRERIHIVTGDVTTMRTDAIVNAANSSLMGGGGVDGAIHHRGGPAILEQCKEIRRNRYPEGLPPGKAVLTTGGKLPASHVIHTVGPIWSGGDAGEQQILSEAYMSCLDLATQTGIGVLAFPAISTGVYGFPKELAAETVYGCVFSYLENNSLPREVYLVFFSEADRSIFLAAISQPGDRAE